MIPLPGSLSVKRNTKAETGLQQKAREWIEKDERTPGIHASDLLDERLAFFKHTDPRTLPDRLITTFLVGKVLHAFVLDSVSETSGTNGAVLNITDDGSRTSNTLGITYSPDSVLGGVIRELKTSRSFYEPKDVEKDLGHYIEQLLIYMAAEQHTRSQLWILFLNFRDENGKTSPAFRAYDIRISKEDLTNITAFVKDRADSLRNALERGTPDALPLCRAWKCGDTNCEYWNTCKPRGRYGLSRAEWTD